MNFSRYCEEITLCSGNITWPLSNLSDMIFTTASGQVTIEEDDGYCD